MTGLYRVVPDSECTLTADDFNFELSAGSSADELRTKIKAMVLHHDHRRLKDLPYLYKKFKGDEARLLVLFQQLLVDGRTEAEEELGTKESATAALDGSVDGSSSPLLTPHRDPSGDGRLPKGWTKTEGGFDGFLDQKSAPNVIEIARRDPQAQLHSGTYDEMNDDEPLPEYTMRKIRRGTRKLVRVAVVMPKVNDAAEVEIGILPRLLQLSNVHYKMVRNASSRLRA